LDLFKIFGRIIIDNDEAIDALEETTDKAEEASESVDDLGSESKKSGKTTVDSLLPIPPKLAKVATAAGVVVASVVALGKAIIEIADSTREYRLEMGKLETAFTAAGHTTEEATETYQTLYSILGETDRAVEASQHIAKLCENEEQMKTMTDACIGAFAMFDDSLPIEGLMEAVNETAKTGQLTGVLADALNWAGASEEDFQKKLDACNTERQRTALILENLNDLYSDAADAYKKNNKDVIAATAAQEKLNDAIARWGEVAEPVATVYRELLAGAINTTADAFDRLIDPAGAISDELVGTTETSADAAAKVEELKGKLTELAELPAALWTSEHHKQQSDLSFALQEAEERYEALAEAERLAAEAGSVASASTAESVAEFASITEQYIADAMTLFETFGQTYENIYSKVSGFFDPFEKAKISVTTNVNDMMTAMQSQVDFNNAYTANLQALKEYGLGSLSEAFQSYGAEGAAYAAEIVKAVEQAGGATSEKGQQIIQGFTDINQSLTESQEGLSQTMALMDGEFEKQLQDMVDKYGIAIEDLDKSAEASTAATSTFEAFLEGMNQKLPSIMSEMQKFGQKITSSLQSGIGSVSIPVNIKTNGNIPGAKCGMDYVPYDEYLVYLHKGEAVLTKEEATAWRAGKEVASAENTGDSGGGGGGVTVNQYIEAVAQTPVELASATAAYFEQARWIT
jgi:hypothetical protein